MVVDYETYVDHQPYDKCTSLHSNTQPYVTINYTAHYCITLWHTKAPHHTVQDIARLEDSPIVNFTMRLESQDSEQDRDRNRDRGWGRSTGLDSDTPTPPSSASLSYPVPGVPALSPALPSYSPCPCPYPCPCPWPPASSPHLTQWHLKPAPEDTTSRWAEHLPSYTCPVTPAQLHLPIYTCPHTTPQLNSKLNLPSYTCLVTPA